MGCEHFVLSGRKPSVADGFLIRVHGAAGKRDCNSGLCGIYKQAFHPTVA
jgi:hypothetical protein